jgi:FkbM family methyltransferase
MNIKNLTIDNVRKGLMRRVFPKMVTHPSLPNVALIDINMKIIQYIGVKYSGVDGDGIPYVKLLNGLIFFGVLPTKREREIYFRNKNNLPSNLVEDAFRVSIDIAQRFCMENGYFINLPRSYYMTVGGVVLDVGAYIGYGAIRASRSVGPSGKVVAVEMDKENYQLMKRNIYENKIGNVALLNSAVNNIDGNIEFYDGGRQNNSIHRGLETGDLGREKKKKIICNTLDTIIKNNDVDVNYQPIFVGLEINGAEADALLGAEYILRNSCHLQMRIAASYKVSDESCRSRVLNILKDYPDIDVFDAPPQVVVSRIVSTSPGSVSA